MTFRNFFALIFISQVVVPLTSVLSQTNQGGQLEHLREGLVGDMCQKGIVSLPELSMHHEVNFYTDTPVRLSRWASTVLNADTGDITSNSFTTPWTVGASDMISYHAYNVQRGLNWGVDFILESPVTPSESNGLRVIHGHPSHTGGGETSVKLKGAFSVFNEKGESIVVDTGDCQSNKGKFQINHLYIDSTGYTTAYISFENWCVLHEDKSNTIDPYWVTTTGIVQYNFCPEQVIQFAAGHAAETVEQTFSEVGTSIDAASPGAASTTSGAPSSDAECVDLDGDGWGWDGSKSCVSSGGSSVPGGAPSNESSASPALCVDTDGDGWGWNGKTSCRP